MKQTFIKRKIQLFVLSIVFVLVLVLSLVRTENNITAPGYNKRVDGFITVDIGYEAVGSFHTTSVISVKRATMLQFFIGNREKKVEVRETPEYYEDIDVSDIKVMSYQMKDDSLANSLVAGILQAGYDIHFTNYLTVYLTYNYLDENTLVIGDKVISVNGNDPSTEISTTTCGDIVTFEVLRDDETLFFDIEKHEIGDNCLFGAYLSSLTEVNSTEITYELVETNTGGPSGGLMQSLYIFNQLTPNDLTGGLQIAGTGTIDEYGNVGKIGGIEQKIITSAMNEMDVFFVPYLSDSETDNYIEALRVLEGLETDMVLVPVQTIEDAINYLESRFGGAFDE
jgi:PDZ domain-containing protein